jgi:hypothetical protein
MSVNINDNPEKFVNRQVRIEYSRLLTEQGGFILTEKGDRTITAMSRTGNINEFEYNREKERNT